MATQHDLSRTTRSGTAPLTALAREAVAQGHLAVEAIALAGRALAWLGRLDGDLDVEIATWRWRGSPAQKHRAGDLVKSRVTDPARGIADTAEAAGLYSSQFGGVLRPPSGESRRGYIPCSRAEFAGDVIKGTRQPLDDSAIAVGAFSNTPMTPVHVRACGATPGAMSI